jgi:parallel beta-helix repeat protein
MQRKVVAVWVSLLIMVSSIVILVEIAKRVEAPTTLYVGGGGGGNYSKIQWAIDNASNGDTVFVYNGTYYENVIVNKTINLTGENKETTIINGGGGGMVVRIDTDWVNITGFTISNGNDGLYLNWSSNNSITDNIISLNNVYGIRLETSSNNRIIDNEISDCINYGISLYFSSFNKLIRNNLSSSNGRGIYLYSSSNNNFTSNMFIDNGIFIKGDQLTHFNSHIIPSSNKVNGKSLYYFKNQRDIIIDGIAVGQLILANCTDFDIINLYINSTEVGIQIAYSSNITIINNVLLNNENGIYLYSSSNNYIIDNNISENFKGMLLYYLSNNNTITSNYLNSNNAGGIYLDSSNDNKIKFNNISDSTHGIDLQLSFNNIILGNHLSKNIFDGIQLSVFSSKNNIIGNDITSNIFDGIKVRLSANNNTIIGNNISMNTQYGIYLDAANNNQITANVLSNNIVGIAIGSSSNNNIRDNNVMWNNLYGIELASSSNNRIYHNNIIGNNIQAIDDSNDNYWNKTYPTGGNFWSDYSGIDDFKGSNQDIPGSDGIGDTNYSIDSDSIDNYPLMEPYKNYYILKQGWNLISIPLIQEEQNLTRVLGTIEGWYDAVQWYNVEDNDDPWKHHKVSKPFGNDLLHLNETMSFWIHIIQPGDTIFLYNGTQPASNQTIQLHPGWNMVGYPSLSNHNRTVGLNNLTFDTHVDCIQWYDSATKTWHFMGPDDSFVPGRGYWLHSKVEAEWEVPL